MMVPVSDALPVVGTALLVFNKIYVTNKEKNSSFFSLDNLINVVAMTSILTHFCLREKKELLQPVVSILKVFSLVLIAVIIGRIFCKHYQHEKKREEWVVLETGRKPEY